MKWLLIVLLIGGLILASGCTGEKEQTPEDTALTGEIISKGTEGIEIKISPAAVDNKTIKGRVTVSLTNVPAGTGVVGFMITETGTEENDNLGIDLDGSDGWSRLVDTTKYSNGIYDISGLPTTEIGEPVLGAATVQVVIEN